MLLAESLLGSSSVEGAYIEDVFSTYLYTGNSSTTGTQTITNGIDFSTKGGMVLIKARPRASDIVVFDTVRGAGTSSTSNKALATNLIGAENLGGVAYDFVSAFSTSGFTVKTGGTDDATRATNYLNVPYVAISFRKQARFFDIVTYTGNGSNRTISHNLGATPGCIIVKRTSGSESWFVYHRSVGATKYIFLNYQDAPITNSTIWNNTEPTSSVFSLGTNTAVNANGSTYVAYLFAHDAGGFGASGSENAISCGVVSAGTSNQTINLGWEPQTVIFRKTDGPANWEVADSLRGMTIESNGGGNEKTFRLTEAFNEDRYGTGFFSPTPTGMQWITNDSGTYIYIAIRRGPMKTPTTGTSVFNPIIYTGTNVDNRLVNTSIAPDMVFVRQRNDTVLSGMVVGDRLRGQPYFLTGSTAAEVNDADAFDTQLEGGLEYGTAFSSMNGFWCGNDATAKLNANTTSNNHVVEAFKRAPGFFDVVCYTGTGANCTVNHGLGAIPEMMIIKNRTTTANWTVYSSVLETNECLILNSSSERTGPLPLWNNTNPTSSVFSLGTDSSVNGSGSTYVAYLFATLAGVSKVGSYTGNGSSQTINCGFTAGARFILIKRYNTTGNWFVFDTARGILAASDPYLQLNSTAAEVTSLDVVDSDNSGFIVNQEVNTNLNVNAASYIFLAIA